MQAFSLRPAGDWDPQGYAAEEEGEDLAALGMRTKEEGEKDKDDEEEDTGTGEVKKVAVVIVEEEEEEVDELRALDRLEKQLKNDEMGLNVIEIEEE